MFPEDKLNIFAEYYVGLYTLDNSPLQVFEDFFFLIVSLVISLKQCVGMDAPICLQEMISAIETLKIGKAPGLDGFTSEFYKTFKLILTHRLHKAFTKAFEANKLTSLWLEAYVALIPKEGKDLAFLQSYRPISLLNVDYKILIKNRYDEDFG